MIAATADWTARARHSGSNAAAPLIVTVTISGYNRILTNAAGLGSAYYPWIVKDQLGALEQSLDDKAGSSRLGQAQITVLDGDIAHPQAITGDYAAGQVFNGKTATIQIGFPGQATSNYLTVATMVIDHVDFDRKNTSVTFALRDNSVFLKNYTFTVGNDGNTTSKNHPYFKVDTPANWINAALTGAGLPAKYINTAAINSIASTYWWSLLLQFTITYPPQAQKWLEEEILKPLGAYWFWNNLGQWTPAIMLPSISPSSVFSLNELNLAVMEPPVPKEAEEYISTVTYRMDGDPNGQNYRTIITEVYGPAASIIGLQSGVSIQSRGIVSPLGGARLAELCISNLFRRYGGNPVSGAKTFGFPVVAFVEAAVLELGDKIYLSHPFVPNRKTGVLGISNVLHEVQSKKFDLRAGRVELGLLDISWQQNSAFQVAPSGTPAWPSATAAQRDQYMFITDGAGKQSDGTPGNQIY